MPLVLRHVNLQPYNTFGLKANASHFAIVDTITTLQELISPTKWQNLPRFVLGGGSNILLQGNLKALVLYQQMPQIYIEAETIDEVILVAEAGVVWHNLVLFAIERGWGGIENLSLIPGSVGAAPIQNIGAYGAELKDVLVWLEAMHLNTAEIRRFTNKDCLFGYRDSIFKRELKGQYCITKIALRLQKYPEFKVEYGAIRAAIGNQPLSLKTISEAVCQIRRSKLPNPAEIGNAGSFFKNPEIQTAKAQQLKNTFPEMPVYESQLPGYSKIPAGWLIEHCGFKGFRKGNVGVHQHHALVLVNYGGARGRSIVALAKKIQAAVEQKFGLVLHPEVNYVP
jgi:UDP-N-acetylmuramate dehydrogenase